MTEIDLAKEYVEIRDRLGQKLVEIDSGRRHFDGQGTDITVATRQDIDGAISMLQRVIDRIKANPPPT